MATESSVTKYCLLCGNELPSGGFSAQVAGVYLYPVCADCQDRCSSDPAGVVAEHPQLFEGSEITNPDIHPTSSTITPRRPVQSERAKVAIQPTSHPSAASPSIQQVIVTDIHMPFGSMVGFMVKWAIASIPAVIILFVLGVVLSAVFGSFILGLGSQSFGR
jgi:hypothetical protein